MTQLLDDTSDVSVGGGVAETNQKKKKKVSVAFEFHLDESVEEIRGGICGLTQRLRSM